MMLRAHAAHRADESGTYLSGGSFQSKIDPLLPAVATKVESGEKAMEFTCSGPMSIVRRHAPVLSQRRTNPSAPPEARILPLEAKANDCTVPRWPFNRSVSLRRVVSDKWTRKGHAKSPQASIFPSGVKASDRTPEVSPDSR